MAKILTLFGSLSLVTVLAVAEFHGLSKEYIKKGVVWGAAVVLIMGLASVTVLASEGLIPPMTSNYAPAPYSVSSSSAAASTYKAFDNNIETGLYMTTGFPYLVTVNMGAETTVTNFSINYSSAWHADYAPGVIEFQYMDGGSWVTAKTFSGHHFEAGGIVYFDGFTASSNAFRLYVTACQNPTRTSLRMSDLQLYCDNLPPAETVPPDDGGESEPADYGEVVEKLKELIETSLRTEASLNQINAMNILVASVIGALAFLILLYKVINWFAAI